MSHIVSPKERANHMMHGYLVEINLDVSKEKSIAQCQEWIDEDPNHFKGGERYFYEVYYHLQKRERNK